LTKIWTPVEHLPQSTGLQPGVLGERVYGAWKNMKKEDLVKYFDHTNATKPVSTRDDIRKTCEEAKGYGFASVCVNSHFVKFVKECLSGSKVEVCSVIGFPMGMNVTEVKVFETKKAIKDGADEIDMVINIGEMKGGNYKFVEEDIREVVKAAKGRVVKVIIECCYLTDEEKRRACILAKKAGAHFVKTSTTMGKPADGRFNGATVEDVRLMKKAFGGDVKAAGGISTLKDALAFIEAGATRLGASRSVSIVKELEEEK